MCKLSVELLSYYIKYKKEYDDLKEYYDKTLKEAEQEHLYSLKAVRYDGVKVDGGQHTDIADKIAVYEKWREQTDKHCEYWLNVQNNKAVNSYNNVEEYINDTVPWMKEAFGYFREPWKSCNVSMLQEILRLKYLELKSDKDIAADLKITAQDVTNMLYTYTEYTEKPLKRSKKRLIIK
jgi:hypothetical protein